MENNVEKYKILANKEQLEEVGISYDITGYIGLLVHKYSTGYYELEVVHMYNGMTFTNNFDIPRHLLEKIES